MIDNELFDRYFTALISGKRAECRAILDQLLMENRSVEDIYLHLFQGSLYKVGDYWERNLISVATEHLATAITENLMIMVQPRLFSTERNGKRAVIACVANEFHQVGAKMIADIFEMNGWDGYFLGSNTPVDSLVDFIGNNNPDVVGLSLSIYFNIGELIKTLEKIREAFPDIPVLVGGQAFRWGGVDLIHTYDNVHYLNSVITLNQFINNENYENT